MESTSKSTNNLQLSALEEERIKLLNSRGKNLHYHFWIPLIPTILAYFTIPIIPVVLGIMAFSIVCSIVAYFVKYWYPLTKMAKKVKSYLVDNYMSIFQPDINYSYSPDKQDVRKIIRASSLIKADKYYEEDVIVGTKGNCDFYVSEINLKDEVKTKDSTTETTIFEGLLFRLKIKGARFSNTKIKSNAGILNKWFGKYKKHPEHSFHFTTDDNSVFDNELCDLLPFINYLITKQNDVSISFSGDTITILLGSDMKLLDNPGFSLESSFLDEDKSQNIARQMNTLFFIIESFSDNQSPEEIEEKLELKMLEYAKAREVR